MSILGMRARNHPAQVANRGALDDVDDRAVHPVHFVTFVERFGEFTVDVAAAAHNARCERYYDKAADGLRQSWAGELVWCNPPYSRIEPWIRKAWAEAPRTRGIVMLLPANRTEQKWWQRLVEPHRDRPGSGLAVEFLPGRMRFIKAGEDDVNPNDRPPFGCCLLIWKGGALRPDEGDPWWAVDHPGIGILVYDDEGQARVAAGTAGTLLTRDTPDKPWRPA